MKRQSYTRHSNRSASKDQEHNVDGTQPHVQGDLGLRSGMGIFLLEENRRGTNKGTQISVKLEQK